MPTDVQKFSKGYQGKVGRTPASEAEHEGRAPQPGVPSGPRNKPKAVVTAATAPTVSISPTGTVTTEHFVPSGASTVQARKARVRAQAAKVQAQKSKRRVQRVRTYVKQRDTELAPKREVKLPASLATPKPVTVAMHTRSAPNQPKAKPVKVEAHKRALPELKGTPKERKAARQNVRQAKAVVAKTTGVTGPLTSSQKVMAQQISKETGLKPRTVATQELQEESGSAAQGREAEGNFDALNIGYDDSGPIALTGGSEWRNPRTAARATSEFFKGEKYGPSEGIRNILPSAKGKSVGRQLEAIGNSGWATSEYAKDLQATKNLVGEKTNPKAVKNLKAAVKEAKELGLKVTATGIQSPGPPPKQVVTKFHQIKHAAAELESKDFPYSWGGGHNPTFSPGGEGENGGPGYDCSGAVSWVLHQAGVLKEPLTSGSMGSVLKPGPGAVTVFYNGEHTFMKIGNEYWGTSVGDAGAGGIGEHPTPSSEYLSQYSVGHVPGLGRKQALQLGFEPGSFVPTSSGTTSSSGATETAFPGMSFSEGGTTATIEKGKGQKVEGKAKFSKLPIELTHLQEVRRNVKRLRGLGVEVDGPLSEAKGSSGSADSSTLQSQLAALEKRYSIGAV